MYKTKTKTLGQIINKKKQDINCCECDCAIYYSGEKIREGYLLVALPLFKRKTKDMEFICENCFLNGDE